MGMRLQCAQCHNHPFDRWTQNDYYSWAAAFREVGYKVLENKRRDGLDTHEFNGEQIIHASHKANVRNPRTGKSAEARFLGEAESAKDSSLAEWLANNPQFARAQVNRVWSYLMGRGLVDPIDDFRITNPPSHSELLEKLTEEFVAHGFNLRHLVRLIANSHAYQLSSVPNDSNREDVVNYSHVIPKRLAAEQLIDAQHQVLDVPTKFSGYPEGLRATQMPGVVAPGRRRGPTLTPGDQMLRVFGKPQRILTCECERSNETSMSQAFQLIGSPAVNELLTRADNRIGRMLEAGKAREQIIEELYWAALNRAPAKTEIDAALQHLGDSGERARLEDVAWALLNSKEFILRK